VGMYRPRPVDAFGDHFAALVGLEPFRWQRRLFQRLVEGHLPAALDLPTGLGKTSVMAIWLIARAHGAKLPAASYTLSIVALSSIRRLRRPSGCAMRLTAMRSSMS
jgi:reverse gyrase